MASVGLIVMALGGLLVYLALHGSPSLQSKPRGAQTVSVSGS